MGIFKKFCIVGLGGHARNKVIPAIASNGQQVVAVVTSQSATDIPNVLRFRSIQEAAEGLPSDTAFFIATPPKCHFAQALYALQKGFDVFVEKPAFLTREEAAAAIEVCQQNSKLLIEGLMHRHTRMHSRFLEIWSLVGSRVRKIDMTFLIDKLPPTTFRQQADIACSALFDIGCYPISLLTELDLGPAVLSISNVQDSKIPDRERIQVAGHMGTIAVAMDIGVGSAYSNHLSLILDDGQAVSFSPFFFGRAGQKVIEASACAALKGETFLDHNGFEAMLRTPREVWLGDQPARSRQMVIVASMLEGLGRDLQHRRQAMKN